MLNSVRNHLGDLHGIGWRSSLLRQVSVSSHDNGVPKWLDLSSTPAGCLLPCIDQGPKFRRKPDYISAPSIGTSGGIALRDQVAPPISLPPGIGLTWTRGLGGMMAA